MTESDGTTLYIKMYSLTLGLRQTVSIADTGSTAIQTVAIHLIKMLVPRNDGLYCFKFLQTHVLYNKDEDNIGKMTLGHLRPL